MEQWLQTIDTKEAAAVAALGAQVRITSTIEERTGNVTVRFLMSKASACGKYNISALRQALRQGRLLTRFPSHPFTTILRAFHNRAALIKLIKEGARFDLVQIPGQAVWQMVPGATGLPGIQPGSPMVSTTDLKLSAALLTAGFPALHLRPGASGDSEIIHRASSPGTPLSASALVADWRADREKLPWDLPFTQAMHGLDVFQLLNEEVKKTIHTVLITKNPQTHAAIRSDASPEAWDKAKRFFSGR